jgi:Putative MetA-pathway of phenol degradation
MAGHRAARTRRRLRAVLVSLVFVLAPRWAAIARAEEIQPDRPEVTESARLVPPRTVQLETGVLVSRQRTAGLPAERIVGAEADLRIGVARQVEVNIEGDPFVRVRGPRDDTGAGDITLGVRYRLVEGVEERPWPPSVAVKPYVKLPVAGEPIGTGRVDFGLLLLASFALPADVELEVNAGAAGIGQTDGRGYRPQAILSAAATRDIVGPLEGFLELFFTSREQGDVGSHLALNAGLFYRVTSAFAVDVGVQTSLHGDGPDYLIRTGLSIRFDP